MAYNGRGQTIVAFRNVVLACVSGALAFTVKLLKKKKRRGARASLNYGSKQNIQRGLPNYNGTNKR